MMNLRDAGNPQMADKLASILNLNTEKKNPSLIYPLLTDDLLEEVGRAFRGRWKVKKIVINDFISKIRGMRLSYKELKEIFREWIGNEEDAIILIRDSENIGYGLIREELAKYGLQGERVSTELAKVDVEHNEIGLKGEGINEIEDRLREEDNLNILDNIRMSSFSTDELFNFLKIEKFDYLKKMLRGEIFHRLSGKMISEKIVNSIDDDLLRYMLISIILDSERHKHKGVGIFSKIIC